MGAIKKRGWLTRASSQRRVLSVSAWPDIIRELQRRQFTGLVEVRGGEHSVIYLLADGSIVETYQQQGESIFTRTTAALPPPRGEEIVVETFALPLDGVRAMKTLIEQGTPSQTKWMTTAGLEPFCRAISRQMTGVVHVVWQSAEGFLLLSGSSALRGVFVRGQETINGPQGLAAIFAQNETACHIHIYQEESLVANPDQHEEYILWRRAFTTFADGLLFEYTRLVGRRLGNSVILELNRVTRERGWSIRFSLNGTTETHQFAHQDEMRRVYQTLLHLLVGHMSIVVGDQLALALVNRVFDRMDERLKPLISDIAALPVVA